MPDQQEKQIAIYPPKEIGDFWIKVEYTDCWCDFTCIWCIAMGESKCGKYDLPNYETQGSMSSGNYTDDPAKAQVYLSGHIKWDGCGEFRFDEQDRVMLHWCGRRNAKRVADLINRLYDIAADLMMPNWQGDH